MLLVRVAASALLAGAFLIGSAQSASATEVCAGKNFGEKFNGLYVAACVGDERQSPVYVTCGSYNMTCA